MKAYELTIFAIGNRSRGDDCVAPELMDFIDSGQRESDVQTLECYQLQPEHCYDMSDSEAVLFIDATHRFQQGIRVSAVTASAGIAFTSHALSPAQLLGIYQRTFSQPAPPSFLLEVGASRFELGTVMSEITVDNMQQAQRLLINLLEMNNKLSALERLSCTNSH